ncbi:dicarboxylate/amino acid:cation symporter [Chitinophaga sp. Mgbs1]|uniref:Dicarboxylate/amino acid:cation symporter n=1 Tax=Chitinophaga solisilvae TaxID=1233460 RepID=A0A433WAU5_9BACT|nr:dicarboxylate/amino acid:cation symporter [Chitinophaga solisilvae]
MKNYAGILYLLCGIAAGSLLGLFFPAYVPYVKPLGDIFLNLLFTAVVPLVFFAIASVISHLSISRETGKLIGIMSLVFTGSVLLATVFTLLACYLFPVNLTVTATAILPASAAPDAGDQLIQLLTVSDFYTLLSRKSMLALMIFAGLTGAAARRSGAAGEAFRAFLLAGNAVMKNVIYYIMLLGPVGLGAYFAFQITATGMQVIGVYAQLLVNAHWISLAYYFLGFSAYAFLAGGIPAVKSYWRYNITPSVTALATCSSIATIPANLEAAERMRVPQRTGDVVIPLGAALHKEGSAIAAVIKVVVALAMVHQTINGWHDVLLAVFIALLVSVIEGGIPNGGYIGQLLIVSAYHLPAEVLPVIIIIGTLLDPAATLLNATGDTAAALLIARLTRSP